MLLQTINSSTSQICRRFEQEKGGRSMGLSEVNEDQLDFCCLRMRLSMDQLQSENWQSLFSKILRSRASERPIQ
jgi:hypothetical protein